MPIVITSVKSGMYQETPCWNRLMKQDEIKFSRLMQEKASGINHTRYCTVTNKIVSVLMTIKLK